MEKDIMTRSIIKSQGKFCEALLLFYILYNYRFDNNENYNDTKYNSSKEDELSFPDYVAPQVHYRGAKRGATNQGFKGRTDRGRFSGFSSLQED